MKNVSVEVICIIDRSGSMESIRDDAIGGFNAFLAGQKKEEGECKLTLLFFNHVVEAVCKGVDIREVKPLTAETYVPGGTTALLDAIKLGILGTRERLKMDGKQPIGFKRDHNRPRVIVAILTDGMENASRHANRSEVFEMVETCRKRDNWDFIFLAANQDAIAEGENLGIDAGRSVNFDATGEGVAVACRDMCCMVSESRRAPGSRKGRKRKAAN